MSPSIAGPAVAFAGPDALATALAGARRVRLSAYVLAPDGAAAQALEAAARRGADVAVRLDGGLEPGAPPGIAAACAAATVALAAAGVAVSATGAGEAPEHAKLAVVDGAAYVDDRNWDAAGDDVLVTRDPALVAAAEAAACGESAAGAAPAGAAPAGGAGPPPGSAVPRAGVAFTKAAALALEAAAIAGGSGDRVVCSSETFEPGPVALALAARAAAGAAVELVVSPEPLRAGHARERAALAALAAAGVGVRVLRDPPKAAVAGDAGWLGSANATAPGATVDWGVGLAAGATLAELDARLARAWAAATPWRA